MRWMRLEDLLGRRMRGYDAVIDGCGVVRVRTWWRGRRLWSIPREIVPMTDSEGESFFLMPRAGNGGMVFSAKTIGKILNQKETEKERGAL